MSILEAGSHCPCFDKKAVFIYSEGRQPCPFWRQAVHDLWILTVHVYILKKGSHFLFWRQAAMSFLEAGSPWASTPILQAILSSLGGGIREQGQT
jgi:hypothetical protein